MANYTDTYIINDLAVILASNTVSNLNFDFLNSKLEKSVFIEDIFLLVMGYKKNFNAKIVKELKAINLTLSNISYEINQEAILNA